MTLQSLSLSSIRPYVEYSAARGSALLTASKECLRTLSKVQWAAVVSFPVLAFLFYRVMKLYTASSSPEHVIILDSIPNLQKPKKTGDLSIPKRDSVVDPMEQIPTKLASEEMLPKIIENLADTIRVDAIDTFPSLLALYHRWDGILNHIQSLVNLVKNPGIKNREEHQSLIADFLFRWPPFEKYFNDANNPVATFLKDYSNENKLKEIEREVLLIKKQIIDEFETKTPKTDIHFENLKYLEIAAGYAIIEPEKNGALQEFIYGKDFFKLCKEKGNELLNPLNSSRKNWKQIVILPFALTDKVLIYEVFIFKIVLPAWKELDQLKSVNLDNILVGKFATEAETVRKYLLPKEK